MTHLKNMLIASKMFFRPGIPCLAVLLLGLLSPDAEAVEKHLFILSGQSNMRSPLPEEFANAVQAVFGEDRVFVVRI